MERRKAASSHLARAHSIFKTVAVLLDPQPLHDPSSPRSSKLPLPAGFADLLGPLDLGDYGSFAPTVEIVPFSGAAARDLPLINAIPRWITRHSALLTMTADAPVPRSLKVTDLRGRPVETEVPGWVLLVDVMNKRLHDVVVAANLATPGRLTLVDGLHKWDGEIVHRIGRLDADAIYLALQRMNASGWPSTRKLPIEDVWAWLAMQEGFVDSFGGGPTGRAINALSRLLDFRAGDVHHLLWSLVGLEALYNQGRDSLSEQLRSKAQALLGPNPRARTLINRMYDTRSRFIHGGLDFPSCIAIDFGDTAVGRYQGQIRECAGAGVAILLASLQELIARNWRSVSFQQVASGGD